MIFKKSALFIAMAFTVACALHAQNDPVIDSLEKVLAGGISDTARITVLQRLSFRAVDSDPAKAIQYAQEGIKLASQYNDLKGEAYCYNNLGSGYQAKGDYENAMNAFLRSAKLHEEAGNESGCATAYSNIGFILRIQQNYAKAISFHQKALEIYQKIHDEDDAAGCIVNIGNVFYNQGLYDSAIARYEQSLQKYRRLGEENSIATIENNIGAIYFEKKDFQRANEYFLKSYVIREKSHNLYEMATSLNNIGEVFGRLGEYQKAIEYCKKSLATATEIGAKDIMVYNYENLAGLNASIGNFEEAYKYQQLNSVIKDSILSVENNKQINELSVKYETEKKEAENKVLRSESARQRVVNIAITSGLAAVAILAFLIFRSYRQKKKANVLLAKQNVEINLQKEIIEENKRIVEEKNKDITDSIRYAKRLQSAILKPEYDVRECFQDAFIFFKPKDIVSGDFYWFERFGHQSLIAAADCTGHGVPGAFMSIIGCNLLSQAVNEYAITQPAAILNSVNKGLSKVLQQRSERASITDGMDIALCTFDPVKMVVQYAGAYNPLWLAREGQLMEFRGDKFPVGAFVDNQQRIFTNHEVRVLKGDFIYLFSDGFADQFGGPFGKKFKYKQLQDLLISIARRPAADQKLELERRFESWTGDLEQVDDVLIVGFAV